MDYLNKYNLAFSGLKDGQHKFEYEIDNTFFEQFEDSEVKEGQINVHVNFIKQTTLLRVDVTVSGTVNIVCDRCLEIYTQLIKNNSELIVKFGHEVEDNGDEIIVIPFEAYKINLAQYFYELIILGLPIQRLHPDDENGESTCDPEMLDRLKNYMIEESNPEDETPIDDRWSELKKLLDNK